MTPIHTRVIGLDGYIYIISFIAAAYDIVSHM